MKQKTNGKILLKNIIYIKTLVLTSSKAEDTRIKQREQEANVHFRP